VQAFQLHDSYHVVQRDKFECVTVRYGKLPDQTSNAWLYVFRPSFTDRLIKVAVGEAERTADGVINTAF
jgi:hypothetical protein